MAAELWRVLVHSSLLSSLALLTILLVRPLRRWLGAQTIYASWLLVPLLVIVALLPRPMQSITLLNFNLPSAVSGPMASTSAMVAVESINVLPWLICWAIGVTAAITYFVLQQRQFLRAIQLRDKAIQHGPAVIGFWKPRVVLPSDFSRRYNADEQALVLAHEHAHLNRGDLYAQAMATALRCAFWFNPLIHFAASRFRVDQELSCDAAVVSKFPHARRAYAEAMLKTHLAQFDLPVGCHWPAHPLKERIAMLKNPLPSRARRNSGLAFTMLLLFSSSYVVWAANPIAAVKNDAARIDVLMKMRVGDQPLTSPHLITHDGEPFAVMQGVGEMQVRVEFVAKLLPEGRISLDGTIHRNGVIVSKPKVITRDGRVATIEQRMADESGANKFVLRIDIDASAERIKTKTQSDQ